MVRTAGWHPDYSTLGCSRSRSSSFGHAADSLNRFPEKSKPCCFQNHAYLFEMLTFIRLAAVAAALSLVPAASLGLPSAPAGAVVQPAAVREAPKAAPAPAPEFGLEHGHSHDSGLAPGQTAADFRAWVSRSP